MDDDDTEPRHVLEIGNLRLDPKTIASHARRGADNDNKRLAAALGLETRHKDFDERTLWLVQFAAEPEGEVIERWRREYGLRLSTGPAVLAFIERMSPEIADRVGSEPKVRACVPYWSELKQAGSLFAPQTDAPRSVQLGLVDPPTRHLITTLTQLGFRSIRPAVPLSDGYGLVVEGDPRADPQNLLLLDDVEWIDDVREFRPQNAGATAAAQGGDAEGENPVWDRQLHGKGQIIDVLDEGKPDLAHPFFRDESGVLLGPEHRKVLAVELHPQSPNHFHATAVAGSAVGDHLDEPGRHTHRGGAWAAKMRYTDYVALIRSRGAPDVLRQTVARGASLITVSIAEFLGDDREIPAPYTSTAAAVDALMWLNEELLVVGTMTNTGKPFHGPPGTAKNTLSVAATKKIPKHGTFRSGRPGTVDGRRKPDLVAVGEVQTADVTTAAEPAKLSQMAGASYATPHVAAAAALVRQYFLDGYHPSGRENVSDSRTPSGALLKAVLLNATVKMADEASPGVQSGWGRLKLAETLYFEGDRRHLRVWDVPHVNGRDDRDYRHQLAHQIALQVPNEARQMKITLVFNDPAGRPFVDDPVVNKLYVVAHEPLVWRDLTLLSYFSNDLGDDGESRPVRTMRMALLDPVAHPAPDELKNNVQQIVVGSPTPGTWVLSVVPHRVDAWRTPPAQLENGRSRRAQGFALVARVDLD